MMTEKEILIPLDNKSIKKLTEYHQIISNGLYETILDTPNKRNFTIEQGKGDILFKKGHEIVSLKSFLPEGFIFSNSRRKKNHFMASMIFKNITYKKELFTSKYFPLMIAHEIGHIINDSKEDESESFKNTIKEGLMLSFAKEESKVEKEFWDKYLKHKSHSERQARYIGYKLLKKLESEGFNVFDDMTHEQVFAFINSILKTYKYSKNLNYFGDITDTSLFSRKESYSRYNSLYQ